MADHADAGCDRLAAPAAPRVLNIRGLDRIDFSSAGACLDLDQIEHGERPSRDLG